MATEMARTAQAVYGPIFIGVIINVLLFGITLTQTYIYFNQYKRDKTWMKVLVFSLLLLDAANTCFDAILVYEPLIVNFGNPESLVKGSIFLGTDPGTTAITTILVQLFFAWRVHILTHNKWIVGFIVVGSLAACAGAIATAVAISRTLEYAKFQVFEPVAILWVVSAVVVDISITATLVWHLRKNKTGMTATDDIVDKIIRLTVQTGLITSVCATIDLAAYLISTSTIHLIFNLPLAKLYTNTLISSLNSRGGWSYDDSKSTTDRQHISVHVNAASDRSKQHSQQIFVNVESHEMVDMADTKDPRYMEAGASSTLSLPTKKLAHSKASEHSAEYA